jgi:hypothetical protein
MQRFGIFHEKVVVIIIRVTAESTVEVITGIAATIVHAVVT